MKARKKLKVLVLVDTPGTPPTNQDFSQELKTADWETEAHVLEALKKLGHDARMAGVYNEPGPILDEVKNYPPDVVFNLTEHFNDRSAYDRNVASLLEMLDLQYTGTGPTGLTLCKNKGMAKEILAYHRIRFPAFAIFPPGATIRRPRRLSFPLFIKPLKEEASYGISQDSFVENDEAFEERVRFIHERMKQEALVEEYIEGRELYVSILGNKRLRVFPFREVVFSAVPEGRPRFSTFKAKWDENYRKRWGIQNIFAEPLPNGMTERIARICKKVYRVLRIRGCGRIDLRVTAAGEIVVLEANPNPNLARDDEFAQSAMKAGLNYEDLIQRILGLALEPQN
ncbi:MAG: ATP-grasp domain-containing protein [Deltaproteobacteria bacterium]|nr:ATP-grasp domain-containing protein [Deltaproteobacteria bacterium]